MSDQNNDDLELDDDYDDVLDESFEEDFGDDEYLEDLEDLDLESDDLGGFDDDIPDGDFDDEWDEAGDDDLVGAGAGAQKKKSNFDMSFNAMVITGAVVVGLGVFVYQVVSKKPVVSLDTFTSALNMTGATDGVVFGDDENQAPTQTQDSVDDTSDKNSDKTGFLYDPDILDSMEMELEDSPPMPSTISSEEKDGSIEESSIVENTVENAVLPNVVEDIEIPQVPRPPEDVVDIDDALSDLAPPEEPKVSIKAEEFLKEKIEARENQKEQAPEVQDSQLVADVTEQPAPKPAAEEKPIVVPESKQEDVVTNVTVDGDVLKKLDMIVSRLDDMESQIKQIKQSGSSQIEGMSETITSLKEELANVKSAPKSAKAPVVAEKAPVKKAAPKKKRVSKPKARWELRAAQPGKAWVSRKGQQNMQPVVIGDTLDGVGRITSISYNGSRWVVQGTSGSIRQ